MAASASFTVTNPKALKDACKPSEQKVADEVRDDAASGTPVRTGRLRAGWRVSGSAVVNDVEYGPVVEYGSETQAPRAMLGRAVSKARARYG